MDLWCRKWIYCVRVVSFTLYPKFPVARADEVLENVDAYQSYFIAEVDHIYKNFYKKMTVTAPYNSIGREFYVVTSVIFFQDGP